MKPNKKIIVVMLDAAEPSLVQKWMSQGALPSLASLYRQGSSRVVRGMSDFSSPATYGELRFGVSPIRHGTGFNHRQFKSGTYEVRKKYAEDTPGTPFWEYFPLGTRSILFDVPNTYVKERESETQIVGWGEEGLAARAGSNPKGLLHSLDRQFGPHPLRNWYRGRIRDLRGWKQLRDRIFEGASRRERIIRYLFSRYPWDFAMVNFPESHFSAHYFWHFMEPDHPDHDPELAAQLGDTIRETYELLDGAIGRIIRDFPETYVCVVSNTGMGPNYSGRHLVPEILSRLGWAPQKRKSGPSTAEQSLLPGRRWGYEAVERLEESIGAPAISFAKRMVPERLWDRWTRRLAYAGNDWSGSSAFSIPTDYCGGVRINLAGREPRGKVRREDYDDVCRKIAASMAKLVNGRTGRSAVDEVTRTAEHFNGAVEHDFPDILVRWRRDTAIESLESEEIGRVSGILPDKRTGAHTNHGLFVMRGSGIGAGLELAEGSLMDFGPTIVKMLGGTMVGIDGRAMQDIIHRI